MTWLFRRLQLLLGTSGCLIAFFGFTLTPSLSQAEKPECIEITTRTTRGPTGFNHLVKLTSSCKQTMKCKVTTSANKSGVSATVPAGGSVEVNTFLNSPASSFSASADCTASS